MNGQIKSKQRVSDFGEVYTRYREVRDMLNLIPDTTIETTYLEPAMGNGNFLIEILRRKLEMVKAASKNESDLRKYMIVAIASIYGVDIQEDNAIESRQRLYEELCRQYRAITHKAVDSMLSRALRTILKMNLVWGNTLTALNGEGKPLTFSEWYVTASGYVIAKSYRFDDMIEHEGEGTVCVEKHRYTWLVQEKLRKVV